MSSTSLVDRLASLRRQYTGEPNTSAVAAVRPVLQRLGRADRDLIVDALRARYADKTIHPAWSHRPLSELGALLLPDAASISQQELECGLFDAMSYAVDPLHSRPPASLTRPALILHHLTITTAGDLAVVIDEPALGPLLAELLPVVDDELRGLPGLRYRQHRRHGELYLLDAAPAARIVLTNVTGMVMREALEYVSAATNRPVEQVRNVLTACELSAAEHDDLQRHGRTIGEPALGSATLRRVSALGRPLWISTWSTGARRVQWPAGRSPAEVAQRLTHPLLGLPGTYATQRYDGGQVALLDVAAGRHDRRRDLLLRGEPAPTAEPDEGLPSFHSPAWQRWAQARAGRTRRRG
jgi:hypothetical protein